MLAVEADTYRSSGHDGMFWDRIALALTAPRSWLIALAVALLGGVVIGLAGANDAGTRSPDFLPPSSESARTDDAAKQFPGGDRTAAILVVTRSDGGVLTPADLAVVAEARNRTLTVAGTRDTPAPMLTSDDGRAAVAPVPLRADLSGFVLNDAVTAVRNAAGRRIAGLAYRPCHGWPGIRCRHRQFVQRGQHQTLGRHGAGCRGPADRHVPLTGAVAGAAGRDRSSRAGGRRGGNRRRRHHRADIRRVDVRHHQRAGLRRGHQLCAATDLPLPRRVAAQRRSPTRSAPRSANGGTRHSREQCDRGAGLAHADPRRGSQHPRSWRAGRMRAGGRRLVRALHASAFTGVVRASAVLAVRPATRQRRHRRDWTVASNRRTRRTTAGADRRNLCSRPCRTGDGATGHHHRAVADRAVSRESRLGGRIREARNAFSRRVGGPDRGHRRHQQGERRATGDRQRLPGWFP